MERFSKSTGDIDFGPSFIVPERTCFVQSRAISAGAGDISTWKQTDRRRMLKGKGLQGISTSLRSLPRETEMQLEEEEGEEEQQQRRRKEEEEEEEVENYISRDRIEEKFQEIFEKIHDVDTRVRSLMDTFSEKNYHCTRRPSLDVVVESSIRSQRSEY